MRRSLPVGIVLAAIAWIVLYLILSVQLWIAFLVAGVIIAVFLAGGVGQHAAAS
jgi:hypothetical protein